MLRVPYIFISQLELLSIDYCIDVAARYILHKESAKKESCMSVGDIH